MDCGAYDGGTALEFTKRCPDYGHVYSFEPDPLQYELSAAFFASAKLPGVELYNLGVYSGDGSIEFFSNGGGSCVLDANTTFLHKRDGKPVRVKTVSLDNLLFDAPHRPTYVKMDVEGAELEALKGARRILERDRPKLAICVYHKPEDIWEIPEWIHGNFPEYRMYLRQHNIATDTVLYCVCARNLQGV